MPAARSGGRPASSFSTRKGESAIAPGSVRTCCSGASCGFIAKLYQDRRSVPVSRGGTSAASLQLLVFVLGFFHRFRLDILGGAIEPDERAPSRQQQPHRGDERGR